jgi:hypothetical protein
MLKAMDLILSTEKKRKKIELDGLDTKMNEGEY